jgi:hypothetical protein
MYPQHSTVRNVPINIRILHYSILHCAQYVLYHQHPSIEHTPSLRTALCAMYLSVSKYCAHCNHQYYSVRTVPISMQIVRNLHASEQYCAKSTHKKPNTANTAPLNTPLCAVYGTYQHRNTAPTAPLNTALCAMVQSVCEHCAHCITQYCTVRNVPISMRILRSLYHSILHCAQCSNQYANTAPTVSLNTALCAMFSHQCANTAPTSSFNTALCAMFPSACE